MLLQKDEKALLYDFCKTINIKTQNSKDRDSKAAKIEQIVAYLENIHTQMRKYSKRRRLTFIECGAGSCYLSFVVYYYYTQIQYRPVEIHCVDLNARLMEKARIHAEALGFDQMHFHAGDIEEYIHSGDVDMVYSLHACDSATDKAIYLGIASNAKSILSVSCCQHTINKQFGRQPFTGLTKHGTLKERLVYMLGDSLRGLLLEMNGYKVDILDFVSPRATGKNVMIRAHRGQTGKRENLETQYAVIQNTFHITPPLENYLNRWEERKRQVLKAS